MEVENLGKTCKYEKYFHRREAESRMKPGLKQEKGFTLIEVLAAIVILSIVSLVLTSYFTNAMSYSKSNQNKTIMVNLARNALFYVEKQDFEAMQEFFTQGEDAIEAEKCTIVNCSYSNLFSNMTALANVLNPTVNDIRYKINIIYQPELVDHPSTTPIDKSAVKYYLIPVKVEVRRVENNEQPAYNVMLEGYITDERIR
jgi:prepilin-type N-terminal cleavage/methylation domain-containing protein